MNRILKHFNKPLTESRGPKIECVSEDDLNFLQSVGNYCYDKRTNKNEALIKLYSELKTAKNRSVLFNEIKNASQERLSDHDSIYAEVDRSNFNEEDVGDLYNQSCSHMGHLISGTLDRNMLESDSRIVGEYKFEADKSVLFMPVLSEWLNKYMLETEHSVPITEFLRSVGDALTMDQELQEVIAYHDNDNVGKVTYAK